MARRSPGVTRVVGVLDFLAEHPDESYSLSELCRRLDLNKATAHSLLAELADAGYLVRDPVDKTYTLGPRLLAVGLATGRPLRVAVSRARPHMRRVANDIDGRCVASTLRGGDIVILEVAGRERPMQISIQPGHRVPCVPPLGTVFVAWGTPSEVDRWLARVDGELSADDMASYRQVLAAVRRRGCALGLAGRVTSRVQQALIGADPQPIDHAVRDLDRDPYFVVDLDPGKSYELSHAAAPVFGPDGRVLLALTVTTCPPAWERPRSRTWSSGCRAPPSPSPPPSAAPPSDRPPAPDVMVSAVEGWRRPVAAS